MNITVLAADGNIGHLVNHFGPDVNILTVIGWIAMNFWTYTHGPQRMNYTDFGDHTELFCSHLWFCVICLDKQRMDCHDFWYRH